MGYLGYNRKQKQAFIPNKEVREVFSASTESRSWSSTFTALRNSEALLLATWNCDKDKVAELIEKAHDKAGNRSYNSEAALSYAIQLAYYSAQDLYTLIPEMDTGKGYADLVYIPKKPNIPALIIELKFGKTEQIAFDQILERNYADRLSLYKGNLILVGINYDKTISNGSTNYKHHSCMIEKW